MSKSKEDKGFLIKVTQQDIDYGKVGKCAQCPIAVAVSKSFDFAVYDSKDSKSGDPIITVDSQFIGLTRAVREWREGSLLTYPDNPPCFCEINTKTPADCKIFISNFDTNCDAFVNPFHFYMDREFRKKVFAALRSERAAKKDEAKKLSEVVNG